jgi:hypothetical protein
VRRPLSPLDVRVPTVPGVLIGRQLSPRERLTLSCAASPTMTSTGVAAWCLVKQKSKYEKKTQRNARGEEGELRHKPQISLPTPRFARPSPRFCIYIFVASTAPPLPLCPWLADTPCIQKGKKKENLPVCVQSPSRVHFYELKTKIQTRVSSSRSHLHDDLVVNMLSSRVSPAPAPALSLPDVCCLVIGGAAQASAAAQGPRLYTSPPGVFRCVTWRLGVEV